MFPVAATLFVLASAVVGLIAVLYEADKISWAASERAMFFALVSWIASASATAIAVVWEYLA